MNRAKNRIDEGNYVPVDFNAVLKLPFRYAITRKQRANWASGDTAGVAQLGGIPIAVEGYLFDAKEEGPEATNRHCADTEMHDLHNWLTKSSSDDRTVAVMIETTPSVRAN